MRRTRRTSTHALVARFKFSALLAHLTTKTLPTLIVVGLEVPVLAPTERPLPFATSLRSIVCFSRIARGTHHQRYLEIIDQNVRSDVMHNHSFFVWCPINVKSFYWFLERSRILNCRGKIIVNEISSSSRV